MDTAYNHELDQVVWDHLQSKIYTKMHGTESTGVHDPISRNQFLTEKIKLLRWLGHNLKYETYMEEFTHRRNIMQVQARLRKTKYPPALLDSLDNADASNVLSDSLDKSSNKLTKFEDELGQLLLEIQQENVRAREYLATFNKHGKKSKRE